MNDGIELSAFQNRAMAIPEADDVFLGGARGGGKSFVMGVLGLRHAEQYGERARILYLRRSYRSLADFELMTRDLFATAYGTGARYNSQDHVWRLPNGGYFELGQLECTADYSKYQGRSFTLLLIDEAGEWPTPADLDRLRSNLRAPSGVPTRCIIAANPGGPGHGWLARRYVFNGNAAWMPFNEAYSGRQWIYAPSTFRDNPALDRVAYEANLRASCPHDPELLKAWIDGTWAIARGAFFGSVLDEARVMFPAWDALPCTNLTPAGTPGYRMIAGTDHWKTFLAHDFGSSAPSITLLIAESPGDTVGGRYYPRGSLCVIDETALALPDDPSRGLQLTVPEQAVRIRDMCSQWGVRADGYADDAIFARTGSQAGSISDEFRRAGVTFRPAHKGGRVHGWEKMRRLFADAGMLDKPGLYISDRCTYLWETLPVLPRDPRRPEDVDSRAVDHGADALRYGICRQEPILITGIGSAM